MRLPDAVAEMTTALAAVTAQIPELQVYPGWTGSPSPPAVDIYPDPAGFQEGAGFGVGEKLVHWVVRARVNMTDAQAANDLLLRLLDTEDPASVEAALQDVAVVGNDGGVSGFTVFTDDRVGDLLGCSWRVEMYV
jgi:hypothetical protein